MAARKEKMPYKYNGQRWPTLTVRQGSAKLKRENNEKSWKMLKFAFLLVCAFVYTVQAQPDPGAVMQAGAMMAMSTMQNGAAAGDERQVEFFGAKAGSKTQIGFGDAVRPVADDSGDDSKERRRRKRSVLALIHSQMH